jgi:hypothetical protein
VTAQSLSQAMKAVGVEDAAQLDVNYSYPRFLLYDRATPDRRAQGHLFTGPRREIREPRVRRGSFAARLLLSRASQAHVVSREREAPWRALGCAGALSIALSPIGCRHEPPPEPPPPTEAVIAVEVAEAPLLNELEDDEPAAQVARAGDLLLEGKSLPAMAAPWKALLDGHPAERSGPLVELRQAPMDAQLFGFRSDLGPKIQAPLTSWICASMARAPGLATVATAPECAGLLHRARLPDGALVAFVPCATGPCPIALVRGTRVRAIALDGVTSARVVPTEAGSVLLVTSRWATDEGRRSGGSLTPVTLSGSAPIALAPIALDEVDARDPGRVKARMVQFDLTSPAPLRTVVRVHGDLRETALPDGRELTRVAIDETHVVPGK